MKGVWAIIPARGGSKGVPGKNLAVVGGKSLIRRAVETCLKSGEIDRTIVSTDDYSIAEEARAGGAEVVLRPAEIAGDTSTSESAVLHVLETLFEAGSQEPEVTLLVQCTSPFTTSEDLDDLIRLIEIYDSAFMSFQSHLFLWRENADHTLTGVNHDISIRLPRQSRQQEYVEAGNAYAFRTLGFLKHRHRFFGKVGTLSIDPSRALEIDSSTDLQLARTMASVPERFRRPAIEELRKIRAVVLDFDGVLTDNSVIVHQDGTEAIRAHRGDGMGIEALRNAGFFLLILSKERNPVVSARATKLGVEVIQGCDDKRSSVVSWLVNHGVSETSCAYVGNDINDLEAMKSVGLAVCPSDAHPNVIEACSWVLSKPGGQGAVRDLSDNLLSAVPRDNV